MGEESQCRVLPTHDERGQSCCVSRPASPGTGYDIFDAYAGAPGTYTVTDIYGNTHWGFDYGLYTATMDWIVQASQPGSQGVELNPCPPPLPACPVAVYPYSGPMPLTGYTLDVTQWPGLPNVVSGFIPDLAAAQGAVQQWAAGLPDLYKYEYLFYTQVAGMTPANAAEQVILDMGNDPLAFLYGPVVDYGLNVLVPALNRAEADVAGLLGS